MDPKKSLGIVGFVSVLITLLFYTSVSNVKAASCQNQINDNFSDTARWTLETQGTGNSTTVGNFFGKQAVKLQLNDPAGSISLKYVLCTPTYGKVSVDFYDDGLEKGTAALISSQDITNQTIVKPELMGVGIMSTLANTTTFPVNTNSYVYRVTNKYSDAASTLHTNIGRKPGWHTLELYSTPVGAYAVIDGNNLTSLIGKKSSEGFVYNINTDPQFLATGIKSVNLVTKWNKTGASYYANLRFTPLPAFTYTNTNTSISQLLYELSKRYLSQYPNSTDLGNYPADPNTLSLGFYENIFAHAATTNYAHGGPEVYWPIMHTAGILAYDFQKTRNIDSLHKAKKLFRFVTERYDKTGLMPWNKCNDAPLVMNTYIPVAHLLWPYLEDDVKTKVSNNIQAEAEQWLYMQFSKNQDISFCVNPWGQIGRDYLPFARSIGDGTNPTLLNAANRDNAWIAGFLNQAANFPPLKSANPTLSEKLTEMARVTAYHSLNIPSEAAFGTHPIFGGVLNSYPTLLSNYNNPTVWSNPNPYYTYVTVQQLLTGLFTPYVSSSVDPAWMHNVAPALRRANEFLDFSTLRSKSAAEGARYITTNPPITYAPDVYGKGHNNEDLTNHIDAIAALSILPSSQTGVDQSIYKNILFNALKYEYYTTIDGYPKYPWYPDGSKTRSQSLLNTKVELGNNNWSSHDEFLRIGLTRPTPQLNFALNAQIAWWHVKAALMFDQQPYAAPIGVPTTQYVNTATVTSLISKYGSVSELGYEPYDQKVNTQDILNIAYQSTQPLPVQIPVTKIPTPTVSATALPTTTVDAYTTSYDPLIKQVRTYVTKGDRIWHYRCEASGSPCTFHYTKTIKQNWIDGGLSTAGLPETNLDSMTQYGVNSDQYTYVFKDGDMWLFKCPSGGACVMVTKKTTTQEWQRVNNPSTWTSLPPVKVNAASVLYDKSINKIRNYIYSVDTVWHYRCDVASSEPTNCTAVYQTPISQLWSSIANVASYALPTSGLEASTQYSVNGEINTFILKGESIWNYYCPVGGSCSMTSRKKLIENWTNIIGKPL